MFHTDVHDREVHSFEKTRGGSVRCDRLIVFTLLHKSVGESDPGGSESVVHHGRFCEIPTCFFGAVDEEVVGADGVPGYGFVGVSGDELVREVEELVFPGELVQADDV